MAVSKTKIEWTDTTWNPVTGCSPISEGCAHCYAMKMAARLKAMGNKRYKNGFDVTLHHDLLAEPLKWNKPRMIFVNSMSDLFHEDVPLDFIKSVFLTMRQANWHTFQVLTKRSTRLLELSSQLKWPENVWMGVTIESGKYAYRAENLKKVPAAVKFLSLEPLIGPIDHLDLNGIDWVIVGGESGPGSRAIQEEWVLALRDKCLSAGTPFFFKQWGGKNKKKAGRLLQGKTWDQFPRMKF